LMRQHRRSMPGIASQPLGDPKVGVSGDLDALAALPSLTQLLRPFSVPHRIRRAHGHRFDTSTRCSRPRAVHRVTGAMPFTNSGSTGCRTSAPSSRPVESGWAAADRRRHPHAPRCVATGPYLHDGSASTLDASLGLAHNGVYPNTARTSARSWSTCARWGRRRHCPLHESSRA
jgi:hypothetical protein